MKYHIFIGSTLDDLKNERKELPRIVMELGHIPVMADHIDAEARNASMLLQKTIEECDYFIALVAFKYQKDEETVTPLAAEYSIAAKKGIPVLALIIDEKARWKPAKKETDLAVIRKLNNLKTKLRDGHFETWQNIPDLCQKAQTLLVHEFTVNPQPGWIREDRTINPSVANELSRLCSENSFLRRHYGHEDHDIITKMQDEKKRVLKLLTMNKISLSFYYSPGENWENTRHFRYIRIFKLLVPELALGKSTAEISRFLGTVLNPDLDKTVRKDYPAPSNTIKKIMADFATLNLVGCISGEGGGEGDEIWEITQHGKDIFSTYRMTQLERALEKKNEEGNNT
jgi:nucleoside 2-deoxyribosyltransferase